MASRKSGSGIGTAIGVVVALLGGYILLKWMSAPKQSTSLLPSSFVGGGYGGASTSPYSTAASAQQQNGLLNALLSMMGKSKGGAPSGGGSSFSPSFSRGGPSGLQQDIWNIANYTGMANNMPLAELNGASLSSYVPDYGTSYIPQDTSGGQLMDLSQFATDVPSVGSYYYQDGGGGGGLGSGLDTTSYDTGSIDLQDVSNFDVSSY